MKLPHMTMMAWSTERRPTAARLMPKTVTALEDWTMNDRSAATRKARASESPVPSSMSRNQGCSASGAAASLRWTRPRTIKAPPRKDAATGLNLDSRPLTRTAPESPSTYSEATLMSKVTITTRADVPTHPPRISASAPWVVMSPERRMLTTTKVSADMLWMTAPARAPQTRAENRCPVHRSAFLRSRRVASAFRFSVRSHIPTMKRPSPPATPAKSSFMPA